MSEYTEEMDKAVDAVRRVMALDLDLLRSTPSRSHSLGLILDPTGYRNGGQNLEDQGIVIGAVEACQARVRKSDRVVMLMDVANQVAMAREAANDATD